MPIAKGTSKVVAYKRESTWGVLAGAASAFQLRRVTADFSLAKETYESNEIRTDRQVADFRHGVRSASGTVNGELSSKTYADFMAAIVARDFTAVTAMTALTLTFAAGSGSTWLVTRSAGSWLTSNVTVGQVVRVTAGTVNAANINKNLLVVNATATILTVIVLNGTNLVAESAIANCTVTPTGKSTFVPATGHTDVSYSIEEWYADIAQSEVYTGMKVNSLAVQLPATGLTTIDVGFAGKDLTSKGITQYFTSPAAQGTDGIYASVRGAMIVDGAPVALITSADFTVERATENATAVGSNSVAEIFTGRIRVNGNMSLYFQDATLRGKFDDETPVSLVFAVTEDETNTSDFVTFTLPKVKLGSFSKADSELGITASVSFTALLNDVTTAGLPATTIQIADSQA